VGVLGVNDSLGVLEGDFGDDVNFALGVADFIERLGGVYVVFIDYFFEARASFFVPVVGVRFEDDLVAAGEIGEDPGGRERLPAY